jgi:hypothetical protein
LPMLSCRWPSCLLRFDFRAAVGRACDVTTPRRPLRQRARW